LPHQCKSALLREQISFLLPSTLGARRPGLT
jgi:hypothetical protein